jgi:RNA polymerase sigma factor (sigma-70 family)
MTAEAEPARPLADTPENAVDSALLVRITAGDREAFCTLHARYYHRVLRFICRVTGQLELAQEGVNDVMLAVWKGSKSFGGRSTVSTWIMGIAYNRARKLCEQARRWNDRFVAVNSEQLIEPLGGTSEPMREIATSDLLEHALKNLSPEQRAVVELTYFHGCSYEDIAVIAQCPVNTVKTRMFYARAKLRQLIPLLGRDELA